MGEKINFKAKYFEGSFDLDVAEMLCLPYQKYNDVELCFKPEANTMNFLFATIDKMIPYDDAVKFGKEIEKRYNGYPDLKKENENLKKIVNEIKDSLYGRNLQVANWHQNGELEPLDSWFEDNDWELREETEM